MTPAEVWSRLGIAATSDERGIKRAYATQLKVINTDADPAAFEALRNVYEHALWYARNPEHTDESDWGLNPVHDAEHPVEIREEIPPVVSTPDVIAPSISDPQPKPRLQAQGEPQPEPEFEPDRYVQSANALGAILTQADPHVTLDQAEIDDAYNRVLTVLSEPELEQVDREADVSRWFAYMLANTNPRSDPIVPMVAEHFGWRANTNLIDEDPAVAFLMERASAISFWHEISTPGHRLHTAWRELTKPATERSSRSFGAPAKQVRELLATARREHPIAEDWFDHWRVQLWDTGASRFGTGVATVALFVLWLVLAVVTFD